MQRLGSEAASCIHAFENGIHRDPCDSGSRAKGSEVQHAHRVAAELAFDAREGAKEDRPGDQQHKNIDEHHGCEQRKKQSTAQVPGGPARRLASGVAHDTAHRRRLLAERIGGRILIERQHPGSGNAARESERHEDSGAYLQQSGGAEDIEDPVWPARLTGQAGPDEASENCLRDAEPDEQRGQNQGLARQRAARTGAAGHHAQERDEKEREWEDA